jgi:hypothetical protein
MGDDWYTSDLREIPKKMDHKLVQVRHASILGMLLVVMVSMTIPVWQSAVNRSLEVEYRILNASLGDLEEQHRLLRSQIAKKTMPEALSEGAWKEDIQFQQIDADHLLMVGRGL